jgi:hypothetical protein
MAVDIAPIEVAGLKEALKELNDIDKKLRRQVTRDFKQIMQPVLNDALSRLPEDAPLSGMKRSWKGRSGGELMAWNPQLVSRNLKAFTSGKKVRDTGLGFKQNLAVFGIRWTGPQATIFDMSRKGAMASQLSQRYGDPSRALWRAYEAKQNQVEQQIKDLVSNVMRQVGRGGKI